MNKIETQRIDIRVPKEFLEKVERYQKEAVFTTRTAALLDLARKGLEIVESSKKSTE